MNTKKITIKQFSYRVPDWEFCNCRVGTNPSKTTCRFCVKTGQCKYTCALHNVPLTVEQGFVVNKDRACIKATAGVCTTVSDTAQSSSITSPVTHKLSTLDVVMQAIKDYKDRRHRYERT